MRRTALTLIITLVSLAPAFAQQTQTPPPPPPAPPAATAPRVATPPTPPTAPAAPRVAGVATGQTAPRAATPTPAPVAVATAVAPTSWQNVQLEVTISDSLSADLLNRKVVSMLILDGRSGQVRSAAGEGLINIDARPSIRPDGRIYLQLTVKYRPELTSQQMQQAGLSRTALFSESLALVLAADGKPVVASKSADPRSDRKVTVEVEVTVVK